MKICLFNAVFDRTLDSSETLMSTYWHIPSLAEALSRKGHEVNIIQAFHHASEFNLGGIRCCTIAANKPARSGNANMIELSDFQGSVAALARLDPDVVHFFGLTVRRPLQYVVRWAQKRRKAVTASFHGGMPRRNRLASWQQQRALRGVSALMFSAEVYAKTWQSSGVVGKRTAIAIVPEVSSPFSGMPKAEARRKLGLVGGPIFAWSGRLHPVKDPLTALAGFRLICDKCPQAQLLMAYYSAPLMPEIEEFLHEHQMVKERVTLLGELPHEQIEILFSAADFFVQTSLREYGGNSLVEAMSCGAVPLVTDIPSFRALTEDIEPARLFACGDAEGMATAFDILASQDLDELSNEVQAGFQRSLAYPVLAAKYEKIFASAIAVANHVASA
jgi:glycosyltransferase involved in cell wall biosynthesis